jgi:hypothetical protein
MPNTPLALQVPMTCNECGRPGTVRLQQMIRGARVMLQWHCWACEHEWQVTRKEEVAVANLAR